MGVTHILTETPEQEYLGDAMEVEGMLMLVKDMEISPEVALAQARYLKMENIQAATDLKLFETLEALVNKNKADELKEQMEYEAQWEQGSKRT